MNKSLFILSSFFLLSTAAQAQMSISETTAVARAQLEIINSQSSDLLSGTLPCGDPEISSTMVGLSNLDNRLADLDQMAFSRRSGAGTKYAALRELRTAAPLVVESWRIMASSLLKAGCVDDANEVYRLWLRSYQSRTFPTVRSEAEVGIEDVRAAKAK